MKGAAKILTVLALVATLLVPATAGPVMAQTMAPPAASHAATVAQDAMVGMKLVFLRSFANHMGMSTDQLIEQLSAGKSLRDIATAQKMDDHGLAGALRGAIQDTLNYQVDQKVVTKDQAGTIMDAVNDISDTHLVNLAELMVAHAHSRMR